MTYILGARCVDGVVMVADRKFTIDNGAEYQFDNKLIGEIRGWITGFSGERKVFDLYRKDVGVYLYEQRELGINVGRDRFIPKNSEVVGSLYNRFRGRGIDFDLLIGLNSFPEQKVPSRLRYFYPDGGTIEISNYKAIGTGAPYGSIFMKKFYDQTKSMEEIAEVGYLTIKYIEKFDLDLTVGVDPNPDHFPLNYPQIWFIPDSGNDFNLDDKKSRLEEMEKRAQARLQKYDKSIVDDFTV